MKSKIKKKKSLMMKMKKMKIIQTKKRVKMKRETIGVKKTIDNYILFSLIYSISFITNFTFLIKNNTARTASTTDTVMATNAGI